MRRLVSCFYKLKAAVVRSDLPRDLPASGTVFDYHAAWSRSGHWETLNDALVARCRQQFAREAAPGQRQRGVAGRHDAAKRLDGLKRHLAVDTSGFLLAAGVTEASVPERAGARALLRAPRARKGGGGTASHGARRPGP